jgi:hypothetical protein
MKNEVKTDCVRRWRGTWFVASVKTRRNSLDAISRLSRESFFSFSEETMRGMMLSMVFGDVNTYTHEQFTESSPSGRHGSYNYHLDEIHWSP